jgi:hypothetical protein
MGQSLPLPERIPAPEKRSPLENAMLKDGFKLNYEDPIKIAGIEYIRYEMPSEWQLVNESARSDLPRYYFAFEGQNRYVISGAWKGSYDCELSLEKLEKSFIEHEEKKEDNPTLKTSRKFTELLQNYDITINTTSGCGRRGQIYIDTAYDKLVKFAEKHKEYKCKVPDHSYQCV